jgi:hypothetical protein
VLSNTNYAFSLAYYGAIETRRAKFSGQKTIASLRLHINKNLSMILKNKEEPFHASQATCYFTPLCCPLQPKRPSLMLSTEWVGRKIRHSIRELPSSGQAFQCEEIETMEHLLHNSASCSPKKMTCHNKNGYSKSSAKKS